MQGADEMKEQARRMRERLLRDGVEIPHSLALEAIAASRGYRDWNSAVAVANNDLSESEPTTQLYLLDCYVAEATDNERYGKFQYVVRAEDSDHAVQRFRSHLEYLIDENMTKLDMKRFFVDSVFALTLNDWCGAAVNLETHLGDETMDYPMPFRFQPEIYHIAYDGWDGNYKSSRDWDIPLVAEFDDEGNLRPEELEQEETANVE